MSDLHRRRRGVAVPTQVAVAGVSSVDRAEAERFVRRAFRIAYGARLGTLMPLLMILRSDAGELLAVLGLRPGDSRPLFLECYLDAPVEDRLGAAVGGHVDRTALVEVGNFAVGAAGGGRWLIMALTGYLHASDVDWAVFTCGPELQNAFSRLGVDLVDLGPADPGRLAQEERPRWGGYYAQGPRVMAASVAQSRDALAGVFAREQALATLWHHALSAGRSGA